MANEIPPVPTTIPGQATPDATQTSDNQAVGDPTAYFQQKYNEAWSYLSGASLDERLKVLRFLRSKGYYSSSDVSNDGLDATDVARYRSFLVYADLANLTQQKAMNTLNKWQTVSSAGASRTKTPQLDVDAAFNQVMQARLGRSARSDELERFRNAYGAMESGVNPPSIGTAAEQQIESANPEEAAASRFASVASMFDQMLRGA